MKKCNYIFVNGALFCLMLFCCPVVHGQGIPSIFHRHPFDQVQGRDYSSRRQCKTRINTGLVFGYYGFDPHYTNTVQRSAGYTVGAKEEIPVMRSCALLLGCDYVAEGASFNSYFFAHGYSFLYTPSDEIYTHNLSMGEFHFPIEFKFALTSEVQKRSLYGVVGCDYRLFAFDNVLISNSQNGAFVYEGQNNIACKYPLLSSQGSAMVEIAFGYQRNFIPRLSAFFVEFNYRYGLSPMIYTGNNMGSNSIEFTLNTFTLKVGLKL